MTNMSLPLPSSLWNLSLDTFYCYFRNPNNFIKVIHFSTPTVVQLSHCIVVRKKILAPLTCGKNLSLQKICRTGTGL